MRQQEEVEECASDEQEVEVVSFIFEEEVPAFLLVPSLASVQVILHKTGCGSLAEVVVEEDYFFLVELVRLVFDVLSLPSLLFLLPAVQVASSHQQVGEVECSNSF